MQLSTLDRLISWFLLVGTLVVLWPLFSPEAFRSTAIFISIQFTGALILLFFAGQTLLSFLNRSPKKIDIWSSIYSIGIGQLGLILYLYLRSDVNFFLSKFFGFYPSITSLELISLIGFSQYALIKKQPHYSTSHAWKYPSLLLVYFFIWILIMSCRELPRQIMLSNDPDQHLFFALQIIRFGTIPWEQFYWGPLSFGYPSGFAAINALWQMLSFTDMRNVVTIQPLLQTGLALASILGIAIRTIRPRLSAYYISIGWLFLLIWLYCVFSVWV